MRFNKKNIRKVLKELNVTKLKRSEVISKSLLKY